MAEVLPREPEPEAERPGADVAPGHGARSGAAQPRPARLAEPGRAVPGRAKPSKGARQGARQGQGRAKAEPSQVRCCCK